ncbi:hypothetical protein LIER_19885 [Lithospermum erythrorhizon]|uniref:Uncharacterized protein n=1 Tax=Lithospermum erythrorhizon TaxID=34254 RepID=A0AAV3QJI9_LITER
MRTSIKDQTNIGTTVARKVTSILQAKRFPPAVLNNRFESLVLEKDSVDTVVEDSIQPAADPDRDDGDKDMEKKPDPAPMFDNVCDITLSIKLPSAPSSPSKDNPERQPLVYEAILINPVDMELEEGSSQEIIEREVNDPFHG